MPIELDAFYSMLGIAMRARALTLLPSVIAGKHLKHTDNVTVLTGHRFEIEFDRTVHMQIDGETHPDLQRYQIRTAKALAEDRAAKEAVLTR